MPAVDIRVIPFDQLAVRQLHDGYRLRCEVFVCEQQITREPEIDALDPVSYHVLAMDAADASGQLLGTARLVPPEHSIEKTWQLCRIAVRADARGQSVGTALLDATKRWLVDERHVKNASPKPHACLHAQSHLEGWYARRGWETVGDHFDEAGIDHVKMVWNAP